MFIIVLINIMLPAVTDIILQIAVNKYNSIPLPMEVQIISLTVRVVHKVIQGPRLLPSMEI